MTPKELSSEQLNSLVTDEMVEKATVAAWNHQRETHPGYDFEPFENKDEDLRQIWRGETRAALVAFLGSALGPGTSWTVYDAVAALNAEGADPVAPDRSNSPVRDLERSSSEEFSRLAWELARRAALTSWSASRVTTTRAFITTADGGRVSGEGRTSTEAMRDLAMQLDRWSRC